MGTGKNKHGKENRYSRNRSRENNSKKRDQDTHRYSLIRGRSRSFTLNDRSAVIGLFEMNHIGQPMAKKRPLTKPCRSCQTCDRPPGLEMRIKDDLNYGKKATRLKGVK